MPLYRTCERCGATFRTWPKEIRKGWGRFCGLDCKAAVLREESFLKFVPDAPADVCWLWTGNVRSDGYGAFGARGRRTHNGAHVYAWERANGRLRPDGLQVCHSCDTPLCVNPAHLFLGTPLANMQDKVQKGRHRWGYAPPKH